MINGNAKYKQIAEKVSGQLTEVINTVQKTINNEKTLTNSSISGTKSKLQELLKNILKSLKNAEEQFNNDINPSLKKLTLNKLGNDSQYFEKKFGRKLRVKKGGYPRLSNMDNVLKTVRNKATTKNNNNNAAAKATAAAAAAKAKATQNANNARNRNLKDLKAMSDSAKNLQSRVNGGKQVTVVVPKKNILNVNKQTLRNTLDPTSRMEAGKAALPKLNNTKNQNLVDALRNNTKPLSSTSMTENNYNRLVKLL